MIFEPFTDAISVGARDEPGRGSPRYGSQCFAEFIRNLIWGVVLFRQENRIDAGWIGEEDMDDYASPEKRREHLAKCEALRGEIVALRQNMIHTAGRTERDVQNKQMQELQFKLKNAQQITPPAQPRPKP